ncbi:unnamed protein product [Alternaria alternata]
MNPYYEEEDDYEGYYADPEYDPRAEFDHPRYFEIPYDEDLGTYAEPREIIDYSGTVYSDGGPVIQGGIYSEKDIIFNCNRTVNRGDSNTSTLLIATGSVATASLATWACTRESASTPGKVIDGYHKLSKDGKATVEAVVSKAKKENSGPAKGDSLIVQISPGK